MAIIASDSNRLKNNKRYLEKKKNLIEEYNALLKEFNVNEVSLHKSTSNLFRNRDESKKKIDVRNFNQVISVDPVHLIAEIEAMTPYEEIVRETLKYGCLPTVVPELKSITIGGALAGVGIESSSFRYGLVHETILEYEILLGDGRIVNCRPDNEHKELFYALPNTYGTLGYALKVFVKLIPVKTYVKLTHLHFQESGEYFKWIDSLIANIRKGDTEENNYFSNIKPTIAYIDGVVFNKEELVVTLGEFVEKAPYLSNYKYLDIYYKSILHPRSSSHPNSSISSSQNVNSHAGSYSNNAASNIPPSTPSNVKINHDYLTTQDYIWRWDTDWFWCSKHFFMQNFWMRLLFGKWMLKSTIYWKIRSFFNKNRTAKKLIDNLQGRTETVIQDIEVPVNKAAEFLAFFQTEVRISPIWICPIQPYQNNVQYNFYKMKPNTLYINFGFWDIIPTSQCQAKPQGYFNRIIEQKVKELQGNKSLYSNSYYTHEEFWQIYDKNLYLQLKTEYDPLNRLGDLYEKCIKLS